MGTYCHKGKLILFDLATWTLVRVIKGYHETAIREIVYIKSFGGILLSSGFEISANVW